MNRQQQKKAGLSIGQSTDSYQINDSERERERESMKGSESESESGKEKKSFFARKIEETINNAFAY